MGSGISEKPGRSPTIDELLAQQLASDRQHEEEEDRAARDFSTPAPTTFVDQIVARGPEVIPAIVDVIEKADARLKWALYALRKLNVPIPHDVIDRLANLAPLDSLIARALFRFDPERAYAMDLHRGLTCWHELHDEANDKGRHIARVLEDPEHPVVPRVLGKASFGGLSGTPLSRLPSDELPMDLLRVLARSSNADVRAAAIHHLAWQHQPEDAYLVLAHTLQTNMLLEGPRGHDLEWLATLNGGERLRVDDRDACELVRRRRCAGLATDERARAGTLIASKPDEDYTHRLVLELGDMEIIESLVHAKPKVLHWMHQHVFDCLLGKRASWMSIATGDERFLQGRIDDSLLTDDTALGVYAYVLLFEPANAHAALQIAYIDRAWGTPIPPRRIAWLRDLGVRDDAMLDELAIPTQPISGHRTYDRRDKRWIPPFATAEHLARVARATGSA